MKSLPFLILSIFLCNPAYAEDEVEFSSAENAGQFTFLGVGQCAPFEGTLFDVTATSRILTLEQEFTLGCNSRLEFELAKQRTELQLELDNQRIGYESDIQQRDLTIETQQRQISDMQDTLQKLSRNNKWIYAAGGVLTGVAISYAAYEAFN